ncbi:hypothetical protein ACWKSP_17625 [Micromonosporaceae bacterium Da 78-11]
MPTAVLFGRVWQDNSDLRANTELEQQGVEYLTALSPLVNALVEQQSSALQGVADPPKSLDPAMARVTAVDTRLGDELKTKARWATLQTKIAKLPKVTGTPLVVYQAHVEVTDLVLALYNTIRRNSHLNRDPDNDLSNLQQAVAIDMPNAVVQVSRMGDYAAIAQNVSGKTRAAIVVQFGQEVLAVQNSVNSLTDSLQAAVDDTNSATLSGSLVSTLDSFRRGVESMTRGANPGGAPNTATMAIAQSSLQGALNSLTGVTLKEMAGLLDDRMNSLDYRRGEAITMGLLAIVLVLGALLWPALNRRREPVATPPVGESTRDIVASRSTGGYGNNQYDQAPNYGEANPTRRERSGALR